MSGASIHYWTATDGVELAFHDVGQGRPVILLHGLFSDANMNWIKFGTADRIAAVLARKNSLEPSWSLPQLGRDFWVGLVARLKGDETSAHAAFMRARLQQEDEIHAHLNNVTLLSDLGLNDAGLGRKEEALNEGRRAMELALRDVVEKRPLRIPHEPHLRPVLALEVVRRSAHGLKSPMGRRATALKLPGLAIQSRVRARDFPFPLPGFVRRYAKFPHIPAVPKQWYMHRAAAGVSDHSIRGQIHIGIPSGRSRMKHHLLY